MTRKRNPTAREIRELVSFLPKLYSEGMTPIKEWRTTTRDGMLCFPWPVYDATVEAFFALASDECWRDYSYSPGTARTMLEDEAIVRSATLSQVKTMLTYCVRGERFWDGFWNTMIEEGHIRRLLERLKVIGVEKRPGVPVRSDPPG